MLKIIVKNDYILILLKNLKKIVPEMPILCIEDAAFDSGDLMSDRHGDGDNFIRSLKRDR
jgi:hypothetical protein